MESMIDCPPTPLIDTLDQRLDRHSINIPIDAWLTLDEHNQQSVGSWPSHMLTESYYASNDKKGDQVSSKLLEEVLIKGIDRDSTVNAFSTHDPSYFDLHDKKVLKICLAVQSHLEFLNILC